MACPACGGTSKGSELGALGLLRWFRCRFCGMMYSRTTKPRKTKEAE